MSDPFAIAMPFWGRVDHFKQAVSSVIAGVTSADQVRANAAAGRWVPSDDQLAELAEIGRPEMSYTTFAP